MWVCVVCESVGVCGVLCGWVRLKIDGMLYFLWYLVTCMCSLARQTVGNTLNFDEI